MREWLIRLVLIAFGSIIGVVVLEYGLSKFAPHFKTWPRGFYEPDEYIGKKGIPGKEAEWVKGRIDSYVRMNSHGFRDKERTYKKEEGIFRIVVLGDSFTEALQVPLEDTFTQALEKRLNSGGGNGKFEVLNLGMSGFGTAQEYLTLKHYGLKYQPDLVVLAYFIGNDVKNNSLTIESKYRNAEKPFFILNNGKLEELPFKVRDRNTNKDEEEVKRSVAGQFQIWNILVRLFPNIYYSLSDSINETPWLANLLWKIDVKESDPRLFNKPIDLNLIDHYVYAEEYSPEWQDAWKVTEALILKLARELEANNIGFLVVVIPNEFEFRPDRWNMLLDEYPQLKTPALEFDLKKPERILSNFLEANKIDYLLLRPEFEKYSKETGKDLHLHYPYDNHWNANGHALAAELIYRNLKDYIIHEVEHKHKYFL